MRIEGHFGSVEFDGRTVTVRKKLRGEVSIPLVSVQSVSIVPAGLGMSGIRFAVAGGTLAGASVALGNHKDVAQDPYALTFRNKHRGDFEGLANAVRAAQAPAPVPLVPQTPQDAAAAWGGSD